MFYAILISLSIVALASNVLGAFAGPRDGRRCWYYAVAAASNGLVSIGAAHLEWTTVSYISAANAAYEAWLWWRSGGGDGTRRRLKSWASRFQGTRRTAPSHA